MFLTSPPLRFLAALVAIAAGSPLAQAQERSVNIYGYFDLEYELDNASDAGKRGTFDQHHFNVLTSFVLDEHFRVLGEIEWEHGLELSDGVGVGEVKLERAWVEYRHTDALMARAGKFLVPFGIYNLVHDATPTFLSTYLPTAVYGKHANPMGDRQRLFSKFGTGVQVLGAVYSDAWSLDYVGYLSNGQGANPYEQDDNGNKALGARVIVGLPLGQSELGASVYTERNGDAAQTRQRALALDARLRSDALDVHGEVLFGAMESLDAAGAPSGAFQHAVGSYLQAGYTLADRLTPFARAERYVPAVDTGDEYRFVGGVNLSLTPRVYLKAEGHVVRFEDALRDGHEMFVSSVAVAF
ncbi:porin [Rubrivirga sp. IMCC45206]|uniref:porin n=1 Tax=Rubrivirga sp. IMCC45206 TaxID=3391614 RepID=UPI00398FC446